MNKIYRNFMIITVLLCNISCAVPKGYFKYDCHSLVFDNEPHWVEQVPLDKTTEKIFKAAIEGIYANPPENSQLMNGDTRRRYFWYISEDDKYLACVNESSYWRGLRERGKDGCFADRFIIDNTVSPVKVSISDSVVCT